MIKNKHLIKLLAFITAVFIFLMAVFCNGGYIVHADDNISLTNTYSINDSVLSTSDYDSNKLYSSNAPELTSWGIAVDSGLYVPALNYNNNLNVQQNFTKYYSVGRSGNNTGFGVYFIPDGSFFIVTSTSLKICYSENPNGANYYNVYPFFFNTSGSFTGGDSYNTTGTKVIDGQTYYTRDVERLVSCNVEVYSYDGDWSSLNSLSQCSSNINSNVGDPGETATNNLYLVNSDFTFNNTKFVAPYSSLINTGGIYPNGSITFSGIPNDYQVEHKGDFILTFGFQFRYNVTYQNQGTADFGPFKTTSSILNTKKKYSTQLHYSNNGVEYIDVPLTQFISNGNSVSWTMEDILSHMVGEYDYQTLLSQSKELTSVEYNSFDIVCNAYISSGSDSSGEYSEWYNPMSNKGYTTSENMKINENPYYGSADSQGDSDYYGELNAPGSAGNGDSGTGSASASSSTGDIVINNYNTLNAGDSSSGSSSPGSGINSVEEAGIASTFYNTFNPLKMLFNALVGGDSSEMLSDEIRETIGENAFLQFVSTSFAFMPSSFWGDISTFFGACLVVLIIAFVFKVIISIL